MPMTSKGAALSNNKHTHVRENSDTELGLAGGNSSATGSFTIAT